MTTILVRTVTLEAKRDRLQKPMADFAEFVKDILKESKPIKRRNNGKVSR